MTAGSEDAASSVRHDNFRFRDLAWYIVGLTVIGGAAGFFAGMSESPVVGVLLPLLFGLIGGSGGLVLASQDLFSREARERVKSLGICLSFFGAACLVASVYGAAVRSGAAIADFLPRIGLERGDSGLNSNDDTDLNLRLALLDEKLARLGVADEPRKRIVARARAERLGPMDEEVAEDLRWLQRKAAALLEYIKPLAQPSEERRARLRKFEEHPVLNRFVSDLEGIQRNVPQWISPAADGSPSSFRRQAIPPIVSDLGATMKQFPGIPILTPPKRVWAMCVPKWLRNYYGNRLYRDTFPGKALFSDYIAYVQKLMDKYSAGEWIQEDGAVEAVDGFLGIKRDEERQRSPNRHEAPRLALALQCDDT